jgi:hypothetical protein
MLFCLFASANYGCSNGAMATAVAHQSPTINLEATEAGVLSTDLPVVLYDSQFFDPIHNTALLTALISPPGAASISSWTSSSAAVTTNHNEPGFESIPGDPAPTAPPNSIFVGTGSSYGSSIVSAATGPEAIGTVTVLHYPSLSFGCQFRYYPAFNFTSAGGETVMPPGAGMQADLYDTSPSAGLGSMDPCYETPLASSGSTIEMWHVSGGGTLISTPGLSEFAAIKGSRWSNDATSFSATNQPVTLIFKTSAGLIVKAFLPIGPYEVSDPAGHFPY